jgi:hypothetical protein
MTVLYHRVLGCTETQQQMIETRKRVKISHVNFYLKNL